MAHHVFTADTIAGKFRIAIKMRKDMLPGDARSDAYTVAISEFGRGAILSQESKTVRTLPAAFCDARCAKGWGAIDWTRRAA